MPIPSSSNKNALCFAFVNSQNQWECTLYAMKVLNETGKFAQVMCLTDHFTEFAIVSMPTNNPTSSTPSAKLLSVGDVAAIVVSVFVALIGVVIVLLCLYRKQTKIKRDKKLLNSSNFLLFYKFKELRF